MIHKFIMVIKQHETVMLGTHMHKECSLLLSAHYKEGLCWELYMTECTSCHTIEKKTEVPLYLAHLFIFPNWEFSIVLLKQAKCSRCRLKTRTPGNCGITTFSRRPQRNGTDMILKHNGACHGSVQTNWWHWGKECQWKWRKKKLLHCVQLDYVLAYPNESVCTLC